jgi:hypothetical protein
MIEFGKEVTEFTEIPILLEIRETIDSFLKVVIAVPQIEEGVDDELPSFVVTEENTHEIIFRSYESYRVTRYTSFDDFLMEEYDGDYLVEFHDSRYLNSLNPPVGFDQPLRHYGIVTDYHLVEVLTYEEPEITSYDQQEDLELLN